MLRIFLGVFANVVEVVSGHVFGAGFGDAFGGCLRDAGLRCLGCLWE